MAANLSTLIETDQLQSLLDANAELVLLDCRFDLFDIHLGRRLYNQGHIPSAQYVDLNQDLSAAIQPGITGRHPLPTQQSFTQTARAWGISNHTPIVAYDADNGAYAARLWWMMRWLGHANVAVLNGGLAIWCQENRAISDNEHHLPEGLLSQREPLTKQTDADAITTSKELMIDARDRKRYSGENEPVDPVAGHIPGAICMPFTENMVDGKFKSRASLSAQYAQAGLTTTDTAVCYCGSGVTATHHILSLKHAGYPEPALYPGSWSEWIVQAERPIETGD
jgi:thiosulfate/3-mercaptopyruvate sulfurtransferase